MRWTRRSRAGSCAGATACRRSARWRRRLGVDLTTVTKAYDAARLRGLIEARGRAGSFVAATHAPIVPPPLVDTGMNMPPEIPGGLLSRAITETAAALLAGSEMAWLHYAPAGGAAQDRAAGAALLSRRGLPSGEEQVIVTAGGQNALHAILTSTLSAGDMVACGRFVYPGFKALAGRLGLTLLPLETIDAATLEAACRAHPVRALYVVPTNDNPTAATIDEAGRAAIAGVARRHDLQVIEDDAYGLLARAPIPPIAAFAPDHCWYVASLSKIVTPALRVAFVRAPSVGSAIRLAADVHETAIMAPPLNAAMVSRWIGDGTFERLVEAMRAEIAWRQELATTLLGDLAGARSAEGYHLWLPARPSPHRRPGRGDAAARAVGGGRRQFRGWRQPRRRGAGVAGRAARSGAAGPGAARAAGLCLAAARQGAAAGVRTRVSAPHPGYGETRNGERLEGDDDADIMDAAGNAGCDGGGFQPSAKPARPSSRNRPGRRPSGSSRSRRAT